MLILKYYFLLSKYIICLPSLWQWHTPELNDHWFYLLIYTSKSVTYIRTMHVHSDSDLTIYFMFYCCSLKSYFVMVKVFAIIVLVLTIFGTLQVHSFFWVSFVIDVPIWRFLRGVPTSLPLCLHHMKSCKFSVQSYYVFVEFCVHKCNPSGGKKNMRGFLELKIWLTAFELSSWYIKLRILCYLLSNENSLYSNILMG